MATTAPRPPERQLIFQLIETARHVRHHVDRVAKRHGTTRAQWGLLARLRREEGRSQVDLADEMELTPIALARLVDRTEEQGLIERRPHASDRRINRLFLTARGRSAVDALDGLRASIADGALEGLSPEEIAATLTAMGRICANIRAAPPARDEAPADATEPGRLAS